LANPQDRFKDIGAPAIIDGENIYVSSYGGNLFSINKTTGNINWKTEQGSASAVTIHGDRLYYSTTSSQVQTLDKRTGKVVWSYTLKDVGVATRITYNKEMLIFGTSNGPIHILAAADGKFLK